MAFRAAILDLDGVITRTAEVHERAWKQVFDALLAERGDPRPFTHADYRAHVDGKPRLDGVRDFLAARGIAASEEEIRALAARKDDLFRRLIATEGVTAFPDAVAQMRAWRARGLGVAVVSASRNAADVLRAAGLEGSCDVLVDGRLAAARGLAGKPAPDTFLEAARRLGVDPREAFVVEDAEAGVEAGVRGGFGLVIGVAREGGAAALRDRGAHRVVARLSDLGEWVDPPRSGGAERTVAVTVEPMGDDVVAEVGAMLPARPTVDPSWILVEEGFRLEREHEIESLFALANGRVGTRGALAEGSSLSAPATFVAGVFERRRGREGGLPHLAPIWEWTHLRAAIDGSPLDLERGTKLTHCRVLDLAQGILWRWWRHRDAAGRITRVLGMRLLSLADRRALLQWVALTPENHGGRLQAEASIRGVARRHPASERPLVLARRVTGSGVTVALGVSTRVVDEAGEPLEGRLEIDAGRVTERWDLEVEIGRTYTLDRVAAVATSRHVADPVGEAARHVRRLREQGVEALVAAHVAAWRARWAEADVRVEGDLEAQRALRFAIYHLIAAADPEDERVSIGARGLTGPAYAGHVFWDTDIYMLPFFTLTHPEAARALLMYRWHTLPAARSRARRLGYRGALYAWESADTGEDVTPSAVVAPDGEVIPILTGAREHHISADVAYAVWSYWKATGDDGFLRDAGAEIVLETARFWASRMEILEDGRAHIRGVVGPDEYHEDVDDDAYTNGMARWNLERGAEVAAWLAARSADRWDALRRRLSLAPDEPEGWRALAARTYTGFDARTGLFEQFRGYFELEEIDLPTLEPRAVPVDVLLGAERVRRSKVVKQPDVLMLLYLLRDRFPEDVLRANFRYYEPRTGHGSSLSPPIHALLAARLGETALAERYFRQSAEIDLANNMGNAAGGVHMAALGGLWQAAVFGFAGLAFGPDGPTLDPRLPPGWERMSLTIRWRGRRWSLRAGTGGHAVGRVEEVR